MLEMTITEPSPRSAIAGMTILHSQMLLRTLLAMILSNASSRISVSGP